MKWLPNVWHDRSRVIAWALIAVVGLLGFLASTLVPSARAWLFEPLDLVTRAQLIGCLALGVALGGAVGVLIHRHLVRDRLGRRETWATSDVSVTTKRPDQEVGKSIATKTPARESNKGITTKGPARVLDKSDTTKGAERKLNAHERAALKYLIEHNGAPVDVDDFPGVIELDGLRTNQVLNELVRRKLIVRSTAYPYQCWLTDQAREFILRKRSA